MIIIKRQMTRTIIIKFTKITFYLEKKKKRKKKENKNVAFLNEIWVYVKQTVQINVKNIWH